MTVIRAILEVAIHAGTILFERPDLATRGHLDTGVMDKPEGGDRAVSQTSEHLSDDSLLKDYSAALSAVQGWREIAERLEYEIIRRANERGATAVASVEYEATLKTSVSYDQAQLQPLLEILSENDLKACYTPQHEEVIKVPSKFNLIKLKPIARKRGRDALEIIDRAAIPGAPRVTLTRSGASG